jgi:hypothetical protein
VRCTFIKRETLLFSTNIAVRSTFNYEFETVQRTAIFVVTNNISKSKGAAHRNKKTNSDEYQ